ncbi:MAG: flagellar type III secretion system protein FlhB [Spirochaetota bacterium]
MSCARYIERAAPSPLVQMHLSWFAAEDEGRTEAPTDQKIRKAQEEGRFAKSPDLTSAITMLFGVVGLGLLSSYSLRKLLDMLRFYFSRGVNSWDGTALWQGAMSYFISLTLPLMSIVAIGAVLASLLQTGGLRFSGKPIQADWKKIAPNIGKWFTRSFGWPEGIFNLSKTLGKVSVVLLSVYASVYPDFPKLILLLHSRSAGDALRFMSFLIFKIQLLATAVFIIIAVLDYIFQRRQYFDSLKMTKHEVKDELKQTEGDPLLRSQIRRRMRELLRVNLGKSVPEADVVVTNPTHFSVALQWDRDSMEAPMVSAKGADEIAFRIRRIARENDIPIMENKPLARGLYDNVEVGEIIPERYWEVVSRILAEVYRMRGKTL